MDQVGIDVHKVANQTCMIAEGVELIDRRPIGRL